MLQTLPKTTAEQRASLYDDCEELITTGFLSYPCSIGKTRLALRSLNPGDVFLLKARVRSDQDKDWKVWAIASSVWLLDGLILLGEMNVTTHVVAKLQTLPATAINKIFAILVHLSQRQNKAMEAIKAYCYEDTSRFLWRTYGHHHPASHSGIPGVESIGTNNIQRMWIFFNEIEDQRTKDEVLWEGFKLSVSPHSPKGVKKMDQRDQQLHQQELDRRQAAQDKFYYSTKGILLSDGKTAEGAKVNSLKTVEDLEEEMYRWVTGQDDQHDKIVKEYKQRIVDQYTREKKEREERIAALQQWQEKEGLLDQSVTLVGYTPDQLQEMLKGRKLGPPGVTTVITNKNSREYLYRKYLERAPDSGLLKPDGGQLQVVGDKSLTEELTARQVLFRTAAEDTD